jgi:hypothetical protein
VLHLDEIQGKQEKENSESGVEKEREQVAAGEIARTKQLERNHGRTGVGLEINESDQAQASGCTTPPN